MHSESPFQVDAASFRDPSGYIFRDEDGRLCRKINTCYMAHYRRLMESELYDELIQAGMLIDHVESGARGESEMTIVPRELTFVSYPYEWSFSMLRDAALLTLDIQKRALAKDMSLKDASAYNVQFDGSHPVFIDTLSFEPYREGQPWVAYGQYCRHFLAPLALMSLTDIRLVRLLRDFLDGVPLDLAKNMLPTRTLWNFGLLAHIRLHARAVAKHQSTVQDVGLPKTTAAALPKGRLLALLDHLESTTRKLTWNAAGTEWIDYYQANSYNQAMADVKAQWIGTKLKEIAPRTVWDLGANTGLFSRLAREAGAFTVAIDIDPACVDRNYQDARGRKDRRVLPLCMDLSNPSPGLGWAHCERRSLTERGPADLVLALALIHHLALGNNLPFAMIADWFRQLAGAVLVEFVPKDDVQSQRLLRSREDIFTDYTQEAFERAMGKWFDERGRCEVPGSGRVLYWFAKR